MKVLRHAAHLALWLACCWVGAYTLYGFLNLPPDKGHHQTSRQVVSHSHANP